MFENWFLHVFYFQAGDVNSTIAAPITFNERPKFPVCVWKKASVVWLPSSFVEIHCFRDSFYCFFITNLIESMDRKKVYMLSTIHIIWRFCTTDPQKCKVSLMYTTACVHDSNSDAVFQHMFTDSMTLFRVPYSLSKHSTN